MTFPLVPVILSGGVGARLWPVSREANPKPFMKLPDGESLLQKAFLRATALPGCAAVLTVTNRDYYFRTKEEYELVRHHSSRDIQQTYLLEPEGRNTTAAIAMAALSLQESHGQQTIMLVMPADHLITDRSAFQQAVSVAQDAAARGQLVTFGIQPAHAETAYGYIESEFAALNVATKVKRFVEKPDQATAEKYVKDGRHWWNSGLFCFQAGIFLKELKQSAPEILTAAETCWVASNHSEKNKLPAAVELDSATFLNIPSISVDYAVMEKTSHIEVIPCDIGWSDVGSWSAMGSLSARDAQGNSHKGDVLFHEVKNTYIQADHRLVAAVGVEDLIIIDTDDAVLVAHRDRDQEVRHIAQKLKTAGHDSHKFHRTVHRPWGTYTVLEEGNGFKIKRIVVKPKQALSLQMHHHRSEHWVVVHGLAKILNGQDVLFIKTNESTYIPAGHQHRLENPGEIDLILIEVQSGDYLGEDDIVRFEDSYGRV